MATRGAERGERGDVDAEAAAHHVGTVEAQGRRQPRRGREFDVAEAAGPPRHLVRHHARRREGSVLSVLGGGEHLGEVVREGVAVRLKVEVAHVRVVRGLGREGQGCLVVGATFSSATTIVVAATTLPPAAAEAPTAPTIPSTVASAAPTSPTIPSTVASAAPTSPTISTVASAALLITASISPCIGHCERYDSPTRSRIFES